MKGVAIIWITILISLFVLSAGYIIFSYVLYGAPGLANMVNTSTINNTQAQSTLTILNTAWQWWPLMMLIGLILFGIVASQRREPDTYSY